MERVKAIRRCEKCVKSNIAEFTKYSSIKLQNNNENKIEQILETFFRGISMKWS